MSALDGIDRTDPALRRPVQDRQVRLVMWTGALLGAALLAIRILALGDALAGSDPWTALGLLARGLVQDWILVLAITLVCNAFLRAVQTRILRRVFVGIFAGLALLILLAGLGNLVALSMLGAPLTMDWIHHADLGNTNVAPDSVRRILSGQVVAAGVLSALALLGAGAFLARSSLGMAPVLMMMLVMGFTAIAGLALQSTPSGVALGRLQNPIAAFLQSVVAEGRPKRFSGGPAASEMPFAPAVPLPRPAKPAKPIRNVLLFAFGSTPAGQAQGWGGTFPVTPHLQGVLDRALAFDQAYAHVPTSNDFLVSVFAAIVPELSSISMLASRPDLDAIFLPQVMRANGFRTAFFNSCDNRFQNTEGLVRAAGFEQVGDYRDWACDTGVYEFASGTDTSLNTSNDVCTVKAIADWIAAKPDAPFFVTFRTGMTQYPYFAGEDPQDFVEDDSYNKYLNALHVGDQAFGKLMAYLDQAGLAEETLVVVVGDHGEAFGEHGTTVHAGINEEHLHVPMALINPQLFSGQRSDLIVGISDVAPTITDLLGVTTPPSWQGKSVFSSNRRNGVLFFSPWNGFRVGYREGDEKFIHNANTGEEALFDLAADAGEVTNLVTAFPEKAAAARAKLGAAVTAHSLYIDWFLAQSGGAKLKRPAATEIQIVASGTSFKSPPEGWVMIDGEHVGGFKVIGAPSNAERGVSEEKIDAAMTTFRLPVKTGPCPRNVEVFFLNDEWAGEGKTGDTDLVIRSIAFAGTTHSFNRFTLIHEGVGGHSAGSFRFWRNGGARVDLDLDQTCLSASIGAD